MLPPHYLSRMQNLLGDEYADFLASYDQPSDVGLRVNTLKITPRQFEKITPFQLSPIEWAPAGFLVSPDERPGKHPYHTAGLYYLQDPAAMAVAEMLNPQPWERVLDLAAAPGGKATHIAALMQGQGILVTNDLNRRRAEVLAKNLERWGSRNVVVLNETPTRMVEHFGAYFDRVLVDAPCSGEGMFRKDPAARTEWMPKLIESCAVRQDAIIADAARLVRPGGVMVYATCTFAPEEDEGTIARFLDSHPEFTLIAMPQFEGFSPGRPDWIEAENLNLERTVRLWPHNAAGEGHFIALLRKSDNGSEKPVSLSPWHIASIASETYDYFQQFCDHNLHWLPAKGRLTLMGSYLYQVPAELPYLHGMRVVHWGWWLGTIKKKRFEPSHALAMGLTEEDFVATLPMDIDDPALNAYLRGDVLTSTGENSWVVVTLDGFPLGWGKRVHGRLKTHLPKWLRQF